MRRGSQLRCGVLAVCIALFLNACVSPTGGFGGSIGRWTAKAEQLRGLRFVESVDVGQGGIQELMSTAQPGDTLDAIIGYQNAYIALGALPPGTDLMKTLAQLREEQILAGYKSDRGEILVMEGSGPGGSDLARVAVHELVHALQHQHFPRTIELLNRLRGDDDVTRALGAVTEGDATFTMLDADRVEGDPSFRTVAHAEELRDVALAQVRDPKGNVAQYPRFLRETSVFPYAQGMVLAARAYAKSGNAGLDELLRDPPLSSAQVLYPSAGPVEFLKLPLWDFLEFEDQRECIMGYMGIAGVVTIQIVLQEHGVTENLDPLLRSWAGDRFAYYDCGFLNTSLHRSGILWLTRWRSESAARHFARLYAQIAPQLAGRIESGRGSGRLVDVPQVQVDGRSVVVFAPILEPLVDPLLRDTKIRSYAHLAEWLRDECFPHGVCPGSMPGLHVGVPGPGEAGNRRDPVQTTGPGGGPEPRSPSR